MSARFPTQAPVLYGDKSTANDVSDSAHWDGADANAVKAEVVAIAAKVGVNGDSNASSLDHKVAALEARCSVCAGSGTLATGTTTTVEDSRVTTTSTVLLQATCAGFATLGVYVSVKSAGSFTLTHATAGSSKTFDYIVVH